MQVAVQLVSSLINCLVKQGFIVEFLIETDATSFKYPKLHVFCISYFILTYKNSKIIGILTWFVVTIQYACSLNVEDVVSPVRDQLV
jgi:hypothetical protein